MQLFNSQFEHLVPQNRSYLVTYLTSPKLIEWNPSVMLVLKKQPQHMTGPKQLLQGNRMLNHKVKKYVS